MVERLEAVAGGESETALAHNKTFIEFAGNVIVSFPKFVNLIKKGLFANILIVLLSLNTDKSDKVGLAK